MAVGRGPHDIASLLEPLDRFGRILALKLYRLTAAHAAAVPVLPCLDHEAMLHGGIDPHVAVYLAETGSGDLHELVFTPARQRIDIDRVSTWGESSDGSHARLLAVLGSAFPGWRVRVTAPVWWRGDRRVADACHAQVSLRDVLLSPDVAAVAARIGRLQTISSLMEKESRVASWGVRTVTGPVLPAAGVLTYVAVGALGAPLGEQAVTVIRSLVVGLLGAVFLYYGLKAVQLTEMANRVWKRTAEYSLVLAERQRIARTPPPAG